MHLHAQGSSPPLTSRARVVVLLGSRALGVLLDAIVAPVAGGGIARDDVAAGVLGARVEDAGLAGVGVLDLAGNDALAARLGGARVGDHGGVVVLRAAIGGWRGSCHLAPGTRFGRSACTHLAVGPATEGLVERGGGGLGSVLDALVTRRLAQAVCHLLSGLGIIGSPARWDGASIGHLGVSESQTGRCESVRRQESVERPPGQHVPAVLLDTEKLPGSKVDHSRR